MKTEIAGITVSSDGQGYGASAARYIYLETEGAEIIAFSPLEAQELVEFINKVWPD